MIRSIAAFVFFIFVATVGIYMTFHSLNTPDTALVPREYTVLEKSETNKFSPYLIIKGEDGKVEREFNISFDMWWNAEVGKDISIHRMKCTPNCGASKLYALLIFLFGILFSGIGLGGIINSIIEWNAHRSLYLD